MLEFLQEPPLDIVFKTSSVPKMDILNLRVTLLNEEATAERRSHRSETSATV